MPDTETLVGLIRGKAPGLRGLGYRVRFDLTDNSESILLDGTGGQVSVQAATGTEQADTVLSLSSSDLGKLIAGRLSPMLAFTTGKLWVEGSKGVALKLASLLDED